MLFCSIVYFQLELPQMLLSSVIRDHCLSTKLMMDDATVSQPVRPDYFGTA